MSNLRWSEKLRAFIQAMEMKIWGINRTGLDFALAHGGGEFGGNIRFLTNPVKSGESNAYAVRLVHDKPGPGTRIYIKQTANGYSARRGPAVCWHAHTAFMRAIFEINPDARIKTCVADYRGEEDFESSYMETYEELKGDCDCVRLADSSSRSE